MGAFAFIWHLPSLSGEGAAPLCFPTFRMLRLSSPDHTERLTASEAVRRGCNLSIWVMYGGLGPPNSEPS